MLNSTNRTNYKLSKSTKWDPSTASSQFKCAKSISQFQHKKLKCSSIIKAIQENNNENRLTCLSLNWGWWEFLREHLGAGLLAHQAALMRKAFAKPKWFVGNLGLIVSVELDKEEQKWHGIMAAITEVTQNPKRKKFNREERCMTSGSRRRSGRRTCA